MPADRSPPLPRRGRHDLGLARIALRRVAAPRRAMAGAATLEPAGLRVDRRREQLPLPPGFVDRRRPRG